MALNFVDLCSGSTSTMKPSYVPKSISTLLKELENIGNIDNKLELLNFHLHQYEVELAGVEGVKDLFPRCMLLLLDAVETLRNEIAEVKATNTSSTQREIGCLESKRKSHKEDQTRDLRVGGKDLVNPNHEKRQRRNSSKTESDKGTEMLGRSHNVMADYHPMPLTEPARKNNRRSWTTELCNSFITAVETLGGPEAATPSEIKKLMQVEGLTTDQVKSHLQKYRHHSRRASQPNENPVNHPIDFQAQWICESFPASIMVPNSSDVHFGASHNMPGHESKNAESSTPDSK